MHFTHLFIVTAFLFALGAAIQSGTIITQRLAPVAFQAASPNINVTTFLPMTRGVKKPRGISRNAVMNGNMNGVAPAYAINGKQPWYTEVMIGGKTFNLEIDTGSSDTWIVNKTYQCFDINTNATIPQSSCNFGSGYAPGREFKLIPNENFEILYGDGTTIYGIFGNVKVKVGGISVTQQIAVANHAGLGYIGDGTTSGYLGLAYPALVAAYSGTDYNNDTAENQVVYSPIFTTMWKDGLIPPVFSLAISRPSSNLLLPDGYLAFGGLPPVGGTGPYASTPIQYVNVATWYIPGSLPQPQNEFYVITPDELLYKGPSATQWSSDPGNGTTQIQAIIDAGSTLSYFPPSIASTLASLFSPPGVWNPSLYGYSLPCTATAPNFAIKISGVVFPIDPRDMVTDDGTGKGTCMSSVAQTGPLYGYILGDNFLKNVIAVFDVGCAELRFRSRGHY